MRCSTGLSCAFCIEAAGICRDHKTRVNILTMRKVTHSSVAYYLVLGGVYIEFIELFIERDFFSSVILFLTSGNFPFSYIYTYIYILVRGKTCLKGFMHKERRLRAFHLLKITHTSTYRVYIPNCTFHKTKGKNMLFY